MIEYIQKQNLKKSISALFRKCQNKTKNSNFGPKESHRTNKNSILALFRVSHAKTEIQFLALIRETRN